MTTPDESRRFDQAPRFLEVPFGLIACLLGLALLAFMSLPLTKLRVVDWLNLGWAPGLVMAGFVFAGFMLCVVGWRLITMRGRSSDGGLLPPLMLGVGGLLFMFFGVLTFFFGKWRAILPGLAWIGMGITSFGLARHRRRASRNRVNSDHVA